mgnify:CR=1 FL=1
MKKSILFSAIIGALLFMTSCLGEVSSNYADTTFVYIDSDDMGTVYGKTISPMARVIISNEMMLMPSYCVPCIAGLRSTMAATRVLSNHSKKSLPRAPIP